MAADIAVVSFSRFLHGNDLDRRAVAAEIYDAFSSVGWVYVKDHGITQTRVDEIFALVDLPNIQAWNLQTDVFKGKRFFSLPLDTKLAYGLADAQLNQGYTADGAEANGGTDHKESYEHRRYQNPCCPSEDELPGFKSTLDEFYSQCFELGQNVVKCLAIALNLGEEYFDAITTRADPQMRILHYPEIERKVLEQEGHARIIPHTDFGLCTLLFQDSVGGLEVDPFHTGDFKPALPIPGTVLINIADLLQRLTNDRCRSTLHRVVSPATEGEIIPARFSIPFFIHPDPETTIDPIVLSEGEKKHYPPVNAGKWRTWNTQKNYRATFGTDAEATDFTASVAVAT